jgi:hypothetical protein
VIGALVMLTGAKFHQLAGWFSVVPLALNVIGDRETAVGVFEKLVGDRSVLLE